MFDFKKLFQSSETTTLLRMLETPEKFQPDALEAAREILAARQQQQPEAYQAAVSQLKPEADVPKKKTEEVYEATALHDIWEEDETTKAGKKLTRNYIYSIAFVYAVLALWDLGSKILMYDELLQVDKDFVSPWEIARSFAPLAYSIAAVIFFVKQEKAGWFMVMADTLFRLVFSFLLIVTALAYSSHQEDALKNVVPVVLFSLICYRLVNTRMRALFRISPGALKWTIALVLVFSAAFAYFIYAR